VSQHGEEIVILSAEEDYLSLETVASCSGLQLEQVEQFLDFGLIEPARPGPLFDAATIPRLRRIERLTRDLEVNLAGAAIIADLIDRLRKLQSENQSLRRILGM
jgi:chaperone modulatory protein CbpM